MGLFTGNAKMFQLAIAKKIVQNINNKEIKCYSHKINFGC